MKKRNVFLAALCILVVLTISIFTGVVSAAVTPTAFPIMYALTVDLVGNGGKATVDVTPPGESIPVKKVFYYQPGTVVTLKANDYMVQPETTGYMFKGWSGDATGSARTITITMDGPRSVTAQYTVIAIDWWTPTPTQTRRVTPTPTPRRVTPTPTRRPPFNPPIHYIEKVSDASEQGPQAGQFRLWTTQYGGSVMDGWSKVYYTISGTATNGVDYQTLEGYVYVRVGMVAPTLPAGTPQNYIDIKPFADNLSEGTETVTITLKDVTVGAGKGSATLNIADSGVILSPPVTVTPTQRVTPTPTSRPGGYVVSYVIQSDWGNGATVSVTIKNNTTAPVTGWSLAWTFPGNQTITNLWNGSFTQSGAAVSVKDAGFNAYIPANGGSVNFGFNLSYSGVNAKPTGFLLNGTVCQVQ
jgi:uncharacterized repeat protein (TIGR02543 family)